MAPENGGQPKKILILAGAGASAHAGYPCGEKLADDIWDAVCAPLASSHRMASVVRSRLEDYIRSRWAKPGRERALWGAPAGTTFAAEALSAGEATAHLPYFWAIGRDVELLYDVVEQAGDGEAGGALKRSLVASLGKAPEGAGWGTAWPVLLSTLVEEGHRVSVFTTNYDPLFEHVSDALTDLPWARFRLNTGPMARARPKRTKEERRLVLPLRAVQAAAVWAQEAEDDLPLVPVVYLHGCAAWREAEPIQGEFAVELRFERGKDIAAEGLSVLWPGRGKLPTTPPYREGYAALTRAAQTADIVLILGCSFRDPALWSSLLLTVANRLDDLDTVNAPLLLLVDKADQPAMPSEEHRRSYLAKLGLPEELQKHARLSLAGSSPELALERAMAVLEAAKGVEEFGRLWTDYTWVETDRVLKAYRATIDRYGSIILGSFLPARGIDWGAWKKYPETSLIASVSDQPEPGAGFVPHPLESLRVPFVYEVTIDRKGSQWAGVAVGPLADEGLPAVAILAQDKGEGAYDLLRAVGAATWDLLYDEPDLWNDHIPWGLYVYRADPITLHISADKNGNLTVIATDARGCLLGRRPVSGYQLPTDTDLMLGPIRPGEAHDCVFSDMKIATGVELDA